MIVLADEKIFYTIQGEGKFVGYPTTFVRLSRCNLRCAWKNKDGSITRCDTPHTSFNPEINKTNIAQLIKDIHEIDCKHVCISGGEPYFQRNLPELINGLVDLGHFVSLETNGTLYRESKASYISLSPKLSTSSADPEFGKVHDVQRINYKSLESFVLNHDCQFKFVANSAEDIREILEIKRNIWENIQVDINDMIWLMPQGIYTEQFDEKLEWISEVCKQYKWKMTDRMHIRIWGQKKGV